MPDTRGNSLLFLIIIIILHLKPSNFERITRPIIKVLEPRLLFKKYWSLNKHYVNIFIDM